MKEKLTTLEKAIYAVMVAIILGWFAIIGIGIGLLKNLLD
jgi:hypothetical protein